MAFTADTGEFKVGRSDIFTVDPRALVVDWRKNLSRHGEEPPVDEALVALARDMAPRKGPGGSAEGSSGQINPITVRPLGDRRLEVVGGFRRLRAALWLIESGECPDFRIKYVVSRMDDAEAALTNLSENIQREDPKPIQLAYAVRSLTEDYGFSVEDVAKRLRKSRSWLNDLLNLLVLPAPVREGVNNGTVPVTAALEISKMPSDEQLKTFEDVSKDGKVTVAKVKERRRQSGDKAAKVGRSLRQVRDFFESKTGPADAGSDVAVQVLEFIDGRLGAEEMSLYWDHRLEEKSRKRK